MGLTAQATEDFMVHLFEDCNLCAIHAKRVTISALLPLSACVTQLCDTPSFPCSFPPLSCACWALRFVPGRAATYLCVSPAPFCLKCAASSRHRSASHTLLLLHICVVGTAAVPKDLQLARRIRGPIAGVSSY